MFAVPTYFDNTFEYAYSCAAYELHAATFTTKLIQLLLFYFAILFSINKFSAVLQDYIIT